jgi:ABC-2 type transport system permease protein
MTTETSSALDAASAASDAAAPSRSALIRTIASREIWVKLHDKGFIASTIFFLVIIVAATVIPIMINEQSHDYRLAAVGEQATVVANVAAGLHDSEQSAEFAKVTLTTSSAANRAEAEALVRDGRADAALVADGAALTLIGKDAVPDGLATLIRAATARTDVTQVAAEAGLSSDQLQRLVAPTPPTVDLLNAQPERAVPPILLVMIFGFLFYFAVLTFGISIAQSVVEEKQSRVVELLVAAVPVRWLLAGKVLGNTVLAVAQVTLIVGVGLAGAALAGQSALISQVAGASGWFLVFFLLGFLMLACLWAVAGSLASRVEDLQSTTMVIQAAVMVPFFASIFVTEPGRVQEVLSYIPFTSVLMMPARVINGTAAAWEPWVAAGIVLATAALFVVLGARLYEGSVLHTSNRMHLVQAWRSARGGAA